METLEVFLRSRGNIRDVQAHLEVSYPTARARLAEVLDRLGLSEPDQPATSATPAPGRRPEPDAASPAPTDPATVLADLAAGRIAVADAERLLAE
jgi:hypothetical protein